MPSYLSGARVQKLEGVPSLRRHHSSPFASAPRVKPIQRSTSIADALEEHIDNGEGRLDATGKIVPVIEIQSVTDVMSAIEYCNKAMFSAIPERAGMNSVRIAEVLNYQKNLPPVVSLAHVHGLLSASSKTEREISFLMANGLLRKLKLTGRGNDISGTGELLITTKALQSLLETGGVAPEITATLLSFLQQNPRVTSLTSNQLPTSHITALLKSGFLVSLAASSTRNLSFSGSTLVATKSISRAHSGTTAAVGGDSAFENLGGTGAAKRHNSNTNASSNTFALSVPNLGSYLRLLHAGRTHLLALLGKAQYKEVTLSLLRERWDGAVDNMGSVSAAKRNRGQFSEVLPARTKKWRNLNGLKFEWVLEDGVGAGIVEAFETGSVGLGVRIIS